jgi:hypothetical protein
VAAADAGSWQVHHMDVKTAFLNGDLQEVVYVQQPPGFSLQGREHKILQLHKALYGLHQAPLILLFTVAEPDMRDSQWVFM